MLPSASGLCNESPCSCMIKFGVVMDFLGADADAPSGAPHELLKLCKDYTLQSLKLSDKPELDIADDALECVLVHVAALGCRVLQADVDAQPAAVLDVETAAREGLRTRAALEDDSHFVARHAELAQVGRVVEAVFTSIAPAPRDVLLLRGHPGLGKSAAAKQGLRLMQMKYDAASCCKGVHVPSIIRGRGAAAVQEDLVRWGRDLGAVIGVGSGAAPDAVLPRLKAFLEQARYVVLLDDADEAGLQEALTHLPPSQLRSSLLLTSQMLKEGDVQRLVRAAAASAAGVANTVSVLELQPFTLDECNTLMQRFCPNESHAAVQSRGAEVRGVYEELGRLPLAVRFFCTWLRGRYRDGMKDAKQQAAAAAADFDEAAAGAVVVKGLLDDWSKAKEGVVLGAGAEHSRGLQGTVRLALHSLKSHRLEAECSQLLALLALCPPVRTPWSLFDGGGAEQAALMAHGRRVVVEGQSLVHVCVAGESCRIPKLKLEGVAASGEVKEGGKVRVLLKDGKTVNVRGSDLLFEGDAAAVEVEGQWMVARVLGSRMEGCVMRQHDDGTAAAWVCCFKGRTRAATCSCGGWRLALI